jgi:hypothetical protein
MVLRPDLPAGGLPALARGELSSWVSSVMYHVHSFGSDNDAGSVNRFLLTSGFVDVDIFFLLEVR